ncbi:MAG TPA: hypothetical protein VFE96_06195 [Candidatus Bathyarchaeia archaeon]|nr:hypothetical protein [Candidatus Bathyarchaeia archaeon]
MTDSKLGNIRFTQRNKSEIHDTSQFPTQSFKVPEEKMLACISMWKRIQALLETRPERLKVAMFLLQNGLSVRDRKIFINNVEIPTLKVARAVGVDRRTVNETMRVIMKDGEVGAFFRSLSQPDPL